MDAEVRALIARYDMQLLPDEGMYFAETYRSAFSTAIVALYAADPPSRSAFHVLAHDEIWHAYGGDPFRLVLLFPDGSSAEHVLGGDPAAGARVQLVIPAGTWQAGELLPGGRYALFGCTMAPGFTPQAFQASASEPLIARWPAREADIRRLCAP